MFLGGKEKTTLEEISKMLGKETIDMMNTSMNFAQHKTHGQSFQKLGKDLMSVDEVATMRGSKCILQVRGVRPFFSYKYDIEQHKNYKYLADYDKDLLFDITTIIPKPIDQQSKKEEMEKLKNGNNKAIVYVYKDAKQINEKLIAA